MVSVSSSRPLNPAQLEFEPEGLIISSQTPTNAS